MQSVSDYAAANCITQKDIMIRQVYIKTQNSMGTLVLVIVFFQMWFQAYMQKTCDVAVRLFWPKKICGKSA